MTERVTLRFGKQLIELECDSVTIPTQDASGFVMQDIPEGYVRLEGVEGYDPADCQAPIVGDGNTALVSDEHVALIQWGEDA